MNPRSILRNLGVGRALYKLRKMRREGFVYTYRRWNAIREMTAEAARLQAPPGAPVEYKGWVIFLTGEAFWYQCAFCLYSLQLQCGGPLRRVMIVSDGTLGEQSITILRRICPDAVFRSAEEIGQLCADKLPPPRYPALNDLRSRYIHIRKLIDISLACPEPGLLLDCDMLFHNPPAELIEWLREPGLPLFQVDRQYQYGDENNIMERVCGTPVREPVNAGVLAFDRGAIDWDNLERMTKEMLDEYGVNYFTEQCLQAMLMYIHGGRALPADRYIVRPEPPELYDCRAPLHHYTWTSRLPYLTTLWRRFAPTK